MSSSFVLDIPTPPAIEAVVAALARPGIAWADGQLSSLRGAWPERSLLLYVPGVAARGVEVSYDGAQLRVRLLAMSSPGDYDLAFRLLEVIGGTALVQPEEGEAVSAEHVRARFGGDWMVRDMATAVAALRAALEAGNTVSVSGPVNSLEISPAALATTDPARFYEILMRAQNAPSPAATTDAEESTPAREPTADEQHLARLEAEDKAAGAPPPPPARSSRLQTVGFIITLIVVGVPALVVRLLTIPFRGALRGRRDRARERRIDRWEAQLAPIEDRLRATPDDIDIRHERALAFMAGGRWCAADRDLEQCLAALEAGGSAKITRGAVLHNLGVVRTRLRFPALAERARKASAAAGFALPRVSLLRRAWHKVAAYAVLSAGLFLEFAGLLPD